MPAHLIAEDGPQEGLILNLEEGNEWIIGRAGSSADFILDDSTVSRKHARLFREDEAIFLENLSHVNPTLLNGLDYQGPIELNENDKVQIGLATFRFSLEELPADFEMEENSESSDYGDILKELKGPRTEDLEDTLPLSSLSEESFDSRETSYDTIFDDSEDDEVPFSLPPETPYLLKVISGPNAGAEIGLEKGHSYVLGKDEESSDILFQDLSVSKSHSRLTVSEEGELEIEDLGSKNGTALNGEIIEGKKTITPQDLISIGTTVFLIIDREAPQETLYSPIERPLEEAKPEEKISQEPKKKDWKKEPIPWKHLAGLSSIAAVFLVVFFSFFSLFKSSSVGKPENDPIAQIEEALDKEKFKDVHFTYNSASQKLLLVGHLLTPTDFEELHFAISKLGFVSSIEENVVIDDNTTKIMNDLIGSHANWKSVYVQANRPGRFQVMGFLDTPLELSNLTEFFTMNFPYLDRLEYKVAVEETLKEQLNSLFFQNGFGNISYEITNGNVTITGVYSKAKKDDFEDVIEEIQKIPAISSVKNFAAPTSPKMAAVDLSSKFQVSGISFLNGKGYGAILNGKIYTVGEEVDGLEITEIEENTVLLEKDGIRYKIDYTR